MIFCDHGSCKKHIEPAQVVEQDWYHCFFCKSWFCRNHARNHFGDLNMEIRKWRKGKPNSVGLWLILMTNGDYVVGEVEWFTPDEGRRYLSICVDGDCESLKTYRWAACSLGPFSEAPERVKHGTK